MTEQIPLAPAWYAAIPFVGFALLATLSVTIPQPGDEGASDVSTSARVWPAIPALMLFFSAFWGLFRNYQGDLKSLCIYTATLTVCGFISAERDVIRSLIARGGRVALIIRDVVCLLVIFASCLLALEIPWNETFPALVPMSLAIEVGLIVCIALFLYFLGQRSGGFIAIGIFMAGFAGIAQSFLIKFKGVSILPSDLYALSTAAAVGEGYSYIAGVYQLWGVMAGAAGMAAASLLGREKGPAKSRAAAGLGRHATLLADEQVEVKRPGILKRILVFLLNWVLAAAFGGLVYLGVTKVNYIKDLGVNFEYVHTVERYSENGFLTSFVAAWQDFPIKRPKGYLESRAVEATDTFLARYDKDLADDENRAAAVAQFEEEQPSIIVVMNETFADLSVFDGFGVGYEGPTYFKQVSDALSRGDLAVSVIGGGTCNTEFEFLTGYSYAFVGSGKYPYVTYDLSGGESLPRQLRALGYATHAIHPNEPTNWSRDEVYETLGFDEFHAIDEFADAPQLHMGATDAATYDKILEILTLDVRPQFIFDVTMQNHGSYNLGDIPEDKQVHLEPVGDVEEADVDQLNEYLACVQSSDQDLEAFMAQLAELDRKVVLVFFGDHQPAFSTVFNDLYFTDEDDVVHQERTHQTSYYIWANYDVAGREQKSYADDASADVLGIMTLDLIGAPLTDWQKIRLASRLDIPALNLFGYQGADRVWYAKEAHSVYQEIYNQLSWVSYLNFGARIRGY